MAEHRLVRACYLVGSIHFLCGIFFLTFLDYVSKLIATRMF